MNNLHFTSKSLKILLLLLKIAFKSGGSKYLILNLMESNIKIIDKIIEEYGVETTQEAKEAMVNFAVLFGEKLVRACTMSRQPNKKVTSEDIRSAYDATKMLHTPQFQAVLEQRMKENIVKINSSILFGEQDDPDEKGEKAARAAVTVKFFNCEIQHMSLGKEQQLTYE